MPIRATNSRGEAHIAFSGITDAALLKILPSAAMSEPCFLFSFFHVCSLVSPRQTALSDPGCNIAVSFSSCIQISLPVLIVFSYTRWSFLATRLGITSYGLTFSRMRCCPPQRRLLGINGYSPPQSRGFPPAQVFLRSQRNPTGPVMWQPWRISVSSSLLKIAKS